jgi:release factor glutamine methyltransferase
MNKIKELLHWGTTKLTAHNIDSAFLDAELLLSFVLNKNKEFFYTHPEYKLNFWQNLKYQKLIKKRTTHYPVAYILGYKEFYGLKFKVNKDVLIPRPETELLVQKTLNLANTKNNIAEIGTGSGCIPISLVKNGFSNIIATDISLKAFKIAQQNAKLHQVEDNVKFIRGDLLEPLQNKKIDVLIANLPYLSNNYHKESSIKHEPNLALYSGEDGLDDYRKLFKQIYKLRYQPKYVLIELNPEQIQLLSPYIKKLFPQAKIETKKDLQGLERVMIIKLK